MLTNFNFLKFWSKLYDMIMKKYVFDLFFKILIFIFGCDQLLRLQTQFNVLQQSNHKIGQHAIWILFFQNLNVDVSDQ